MFPSGSVTLVSNNVWIVKNFLANRSCKKFRHIWLQDSELKRWLGAYCLSC